MTTVGMPVGKKSPKSELHEFYQLHPGNPTFVIKSLTNPPAEPLFLCTLTCPAMSGPQGLPEQNFTGQGRNKKTAEQYASEKALQFLRDKGLMAPALLEMDPSQLPAELQRQLQAGGHTNTLQKLQAKAIQQQMKAFGTTAAPDPPAVLPDSATNGDDASASASASASSADEDLEALDKEALITKLKQALKENKRLENEVSADSVKRRKVVNILLGVDPES